MLLLLLAQLMTALSVGNLAAELSASGLARFKQLGGISILSSFYLPLFRVRIVVAAIFFPTGADSQIKISLSRLFGVNKASTIAFGCATEIQERIYIKAANFI